MPRGLLRHLHGDRYDVSSAGTLLKERKPLAIRAMAERVRLDSLRARDAAKASGEETIPFEEAIAEIEKDRDDLYNILILPRAAKELAKLQGGHYERARDAIRALSIDLGPSGCLKLR